MTALQISTIIWKEKLINYLSGKRVEIIEKSKMQVEIQKPSTDKDSNIRVKDLKGNWTHDKQKVP